MKIGQKFKTLTPRKYFFYIDHYEKYTDFNTLGLYRSIGLPPPSYHLYRKETDMRKGFNLLCGIITNELGQHVTKGDVFIFINKPRTTCSKS